MGDAIRQIQAAFQLWQRQSLRERNARTNAVRRRSPTRCKAGQTWGTSRSNVCLRISSNSWVGLNGLVRKMAAPEDSASSRLYLCGLAVSMITGMARVAGSCLSCRRAVRPSMFGIMASITTTQGFSDRKSTRLNSSHVEISYAVFCLKKKRKHKTDQRDHA